MTDYNEQIAAIDSELAALTQPDRDREAEARQRQQRLTELAEQREQLTRDSAYARCEEVLKHAPAALADNRKAVQLLYTAFEKHDFDGAFAAVERVTETFDALRRVNSAALSHVQPLANEHHRQQKQKKEAQGVVVDTFTEDSWRGSILNPIVSRFQYGSTARAAIIAAIARAGSDRERQIAYGMAFALTAEDFTRIPLDTDPEDLTKRSVH